MTGKQLIQIVPRRAKTPEGVGDYSRLLAEQMLADYDINTKFLSGTALRAEQKLIDKWETETVSSRTQSGLLEAMKRLMPCDAVLVHYSGYGYNKRGLPNWLTGGIKSIKTKYPNIPVATLFHELNAVTGKIWNSSFWLSPLQAHLCKTLALDSSLVLTTTKDYAEKLSGWHPQIAPLVIPVFSTIGEAKSPKPIAKRKRILAAFGTTKLENRLYADGLETLEKLVKIFQIAEIWDIGARNGALPHQIGDASVVTFGRCEADKISEMLNNAMFGLVDAPVEVLEKSTICAAHIANGAIPVMFCEKRDQNASGYYLLGSDTKSDVLSLEQLADFQTTNTTTYWQQRSLKSTTQRIANELFEKIPK